MNLKHKTKALPTLVMPLLIAIACGDGDIKNASHAELDGSTSGVVIRSAAGEGEQSIAEAVNAYRLDLGGANNLGTAGTQADGHREINWDGVPAAISSPNNFPGQTFKNRGLLISATGVKLEVSTKQEEASQAVPLFGNLNANLPNVLATFSPEKLFSPVLSTVTELTFTVPGSDTKATVSGFGAVFTDVDIAGISRIEYYDLSHKKIHTEWVKPVWSKDRSLSFVGVTFKSGKPVAKVKIYSGNLKLGSNEKENKWKDAVALDDFLYGEPKAAPQW